jgi:hypothetical protein
VTISYLSGFNFGCLSSVSSQGRWEGRAEVRVSLFE